MHCYCEDCATVKWSCREIVLSLLCMFSVRASFAYTNDKLTNLLHWSPILQGADIIEQCCNNDLERLVKLGETGKLLLYVLNCVNQVPFTL